MKVNTYKELAEQPGMIMYSGVSSVFRGKSDPVTEVIHFIFNTKKDGNGVHQAVLVDSDYNVINNKVLMFADINEFLGLANYMIRNGVAVSK